MDNTDGRVEETFAAAAAAAAIPDQELMQLQQLLLTKLEALPSLRWGDIPGQGYAACWQWAP